jgi:hypothetical protein
MVRIRRSKTDTRYFIEIPKKREKEEEEDGSNSERS